jgi:hypothetical protein
MPNLRGPARVAGFGFLVACGLTARLFLPWYAPASVDLESYSIVAETVANGRPLYETRRYNYPPVWAGAIRALDLIAGAGKMSFDGVVRSFLGVIDVATVVVLMRLARCRSIDRWKVAGLFLANPVSIWVTAVQGQFDNVSVLFLLIAILASERRPTTGRAAALLAVGFLTASILIKQVTALHPLLWLRRVPRRVLLLAPYIVTAAAFLPFARQWRAIRDNVLFYRAVPRSYGFSEWILYNSRWGAPVALLGLAAGLVAAWRLKDESDLVRACLILFLVLLAFAPGFGTQYLVWPLTLGAVRSGAGYFLCTISGILWTLGSHLGVPGSGQFMGHLIWLCIVFWLVREFSGIRPRVGGQEPVG